METKAIQAQAMRTPDFSAMNRSFLHSIILQVEMRGVHLGLGLVSRHAALLKVITQEPPSHGYVLSLGNADDELVYLISNAEGDTHKSTR